MTESLLMECEGCKRKVSKEAENCPHCGHPVVVDRCRQCGGPLQRGTAKVTSAAGWGWGIPLLVFGALGALFAGIIVGGIVMLVALAILGLARIEKPALKCRKCGAYRLFKA